VLHGRRLSGLIVETEAYLGIPDRAAHTFGGRRTKRNASMWRDGGTAYVYFTYGMHHCLNVVAGREDQPVAVLLRALEPVEGQDIMSANRPQARRARDLCSGPAKLCQALAIDRRLDGIDLTAGAPMWIEPARTAPLPPKAIARTARIGVAYAGPWAHKPLRFYLRDNPHVSRP
jgi:DNA-3-methyladenine glycosylase